VRDDGFGEVTDVGEFFGDAHVFECAGVIFRGKEVIAIFEAQSFADIFEGVGPADADGFFSECEDLLFALVEELFCENPRDLMPGMDGFTVLKHVRAEPSIQGLTVYVFSNSNLTPEISRAYALGASGYHQKPARYLDLVALL
jgi:DNA-binding NarL/FixJ family response regulator